MKHLLHSLLTALLIFFVCSLSSCWGFFNKPYTEYTEPKRWAWKPVYALDTSYRTIAYDDARPVVNAGKIYVKDNLIYQCEVGKGIHITDNTNPSTAHRIGFIEVPGCEEISIKGNILYTNNYYDLISINISDLTKPTITSRTRNVFYGDSGMPHSWEQPDSSGYYECAKFYSDSVIVKWVKDSVVSYCYKP